MLYSRNFVNAQSVLDIAHSVCVLYCPFWCSGTLLCKSSASSSSVTCRRVWQSLVNCRCERVECWPGSAGRPHRPGACRQRRGLRPVGGLPHARSCRQNVALSYKDQQRTTPEPRPNFRTTSPIRPVNQAPTTPRWIYEWLPIVLRKGNYCCH